MAYRPHHMQHPPGVDPQRAIEDAAEARYAARTRCRHRGEPLGQVPCRACRGQQNLDSYHCDLHDCVCVELRRPVDPAIRWCHLCPDKASEALTQSAPAD